MNIKYSLLILKQMICQREEDTSLWKSVESPWVQQMFGEKCPHSNPNSFSCQKI